MSLSANQRDGQYVDGTFAATKRGTYISCRFLVHFRTASPRFCLQTIAATNHRPGLPNLVGGGGVGRRHCQPSLWPRPTPINCTNGKSTVRSSQPKMMYRRFRGTYVPESRSARWWSCLTSLP